MIDMKPTTWIWLPIHTVLAAIITLSLSENLGLGGAERSVASVFWFFPAIIFLGYKSATYFKAAEYSSSRKVMLMFLWILPSIPLSIISWMGIILLLETGFGIFNS